MFSIPNRQSQTVNRSHFALRQTLTGSIERTGVGLHSGERATVRVLPEKAGVGRYFVRVDLPDAPVIPARVEAVSQTTLSTELAVGEASVRTVEHLLAALAGSGVDDARIEIDGSEVPLLDGSAKEWVEAIATVGRESAKAGDAAIGDCPLTLTEPIWVQHGDAFVAALPAPETRFTYGIDFEHPAIGNQWHSWLLGSQESFASAIAPARTFGFARQVEQLRQAGLIKGGSLENALVCGDDGWLNPPLRFANEPARHKLLDLVGDLSLLGIFPVAHFLAYKASHNLHVQLAKQLLRLIND
ncbi:MAG: UDP-3-O-acyl-N-acetylglucosamine deacetylase [Kastovskya adunca ATA6-11-RM4]|jgi:UDP-3-O-[3-hydroxymyristoyl] N-acetylglucosamine deacetylase|nr:UDP-3-O-acyl-N-acetylglucosamine deacetylase [Kastovskya adunca ATA6-11-RM4]